MAAEQYSETKKLKVCYVLSYKSPNYIRTGVLIGALKKISWVDLSEARNTTKSFLRYPQTLFRLVANRIRYRPDVYILGFRGHEMYWPVRILTFGKPLIFDEFINSDDWLSNENKKPYIKNWMVWLAKAASTSILKNASHVLADTMLDASSSAGAHGVSLKKYSVIYVGADENYFYPQEVKNQTDKFEVFFYGTMAPLHGLEYILRSAKELSDKPIHFTIAGGKGKPKMIQFVEEFITSNKLNNVTYEQWVAYEEIPDYMRRSDVCLGGPFGNTSQSKRVVTGKTFQSLAVGAAVIVGKIKEDVGLIDKVNCLIVDQASVGELSKTLEWCLANKGELPGIGSKGRILYEEKYSVKKVAENIEKILTRVTS